jgi:hypothetical protein
VDIITSVVKMVTTSFITAEVVDLLLAALMVVSLRVVIPTRKLELVLVVPLVEETLVTGILVEPMPKQPVDRGTVGRHKLKRLPPITAVKFPTVLLLVRPQPLVATQVERAVVPVRLVVATVVALVLEVSPAVADIPEASPVVAMLVDSVEAVVMQAVTVVAVIGKRKRRDDSKQKQK